MDYAVKVYFQVYVTDRDTGQDRLHRTSRVLPVPRAEDAIQIADAISRASDGRTATRTFAMPVIRMPVDKGSVHVPLTELDHWLQELTAARDEYDEFVTKPKAA